MTLLRGIGCMGRCNLRTRPAPASPPVPTPDAQCLGPQRFELALIPFSGTRDARRSHLSRVASGFLYPPMVHVMERRPQPAADTLTHTATAAALPPLFSLGPAHLQVSGFKRADDGRGYILRFWENEGRAANAALKMSPIFTRAWMTNLAEEPGDEIPIRKGMVSVGVRPFGIITLRLEAAPTD